MMSDSCLICFYVFFFKQKTAYEMRISDWSSDVCSSDLWQFAPLYGHRCAEESRRGTGGCQDRWRAGASPRTGDRRRLMSTANRLTRFFTTLAAVATFAAAVAPVSGVAATYDARNGQVETADTPRPILLAKSPQASKRPTTR